ncbi:MAG TPA: DUF6356 family protein [Pseudomonadales bacterium]
MLQLVRDFREHPESVGESYFEHWQAAMGFAATLLACAVMCAIHAFVPGLFKYSASRRLCALHERMVTRRRSAEIECDSRPEAAPTGASGR